MPTAAKPSFLSAPDHCPVICFEGIEGSGKSTQIDKLLAHLKGKNIETVLLREPGATPLGEAIRELILHKTSSLDPTAEALLFAASRAQLIKERLQPLFLQKKPQLIILDRFLASSMAYQGGGLQLGEKYITEIHKKTPLNFRPQLTFYLRIDLAKSHERLLGREDKKDLIESRNEKFFNRVIKAYDSYFSFAKSQGMHVSQIDGHQNQNQVFKEILKKMAPFIDQIS